MKINSNFILREVAGEYVLIPVGEAALETKGLITLSESGYCLYDSLLKGATKVELIEKMLNEYDNSDVESVTADVEQFLEQMRILGIISED